jgi:dephospho-CoA kinase
MMLVIGLTGSIGMGKSAAAQYFRTLGIPVCDADAEVHRLYEGEAVPAIAASFPKAVRGGKVDRALLAQEVAGSPQKLARLESIVHPMVVEAEIDFLRQQEQRGAAFAVLEIPLLFETDARSRVDVTIVASAPEEVQKARVLARPGMTEAKLAALLSRQIPDKEKRARADFIVDTGTTLQDMERQIDKLIESLKGREGRVMERWRSR